MNTENTYTLIYPVTFEGEEFKELTFRRLKVKDRRRCMKLHDHEVDIEIQAIADACEVPFEVIEELDGDDFDGLQQRMASGKKPTGSGD